jgi:phage baseplate assembly protein gpV
MRPVWIIITLLALAPAVTALADPVAGDFYAYRYSVSYGDRSVEGSVRVTVVSVVESGTLRLRVEATFSDGVMTFEKNLPESAFFVPTLQLPDSGSFSYSREGHQVSVSVTRTGSGSRTVGGRTYETAIYSVTARFTSPNRTFTISGSVEVVSGSYALYSVDLTLSAAGNRAVRFSAVLTDTNLDLSRVRESVKTADGSALAAMAPSIFAAGGSRGSEVSDALSLLTGLQSQMPTVNAPGSSASGEDLTLKVVSITAIGLAAIGSVAAVGLLRRPKRVPVSTSKPHYV